MDRRKGLAHVAAVGGAVAGLGVFRVFREADASEVRFEQPGHRLVGPERLVNGGLRGDSDAAAGRGAGALGGGLESAQQLVAVVTVERAKVEVGSRVLRNDVRLLTTLDDDAVDSRIRA